MTILPEDLVEEILSRVPARSLKRLRSTCKRWNGLFDDKRFARKHSAKESLVLMLTKDYMIFPSVEVNIELSLLEPHYNISYQFDISVVFHCDGLLLCTSEDDSRIVVWNPFTGQTRWLQPSVSGNFALGYDSNKSYKILSYRNCSKGYEIYEFDSDSWRVLDDDIAPGWDLVTTEQCVSLRGNIYMFAIHETKTPLYSLSLLRFDFSTEKSEHLPFPYQQLDCYESTILSVVSEERISVLLQRDATSKTEIWVTDKIGGTKAVSWSKFLELDLSSYLQDFYLLSFVLDEEKIFFLSCDRYDNKYEVCIVGEGKKVTRVDPGVDTTDQGWAAVLNYVPSLVQIE